MSEGKYSGRFVREGNEGEGGWICVEEFMPAGARVLPSYVAELREYTERDCRQIFRQMVKIIKLSHDNEMAHTNIHAENWLIDRSVSRED